MDKKLVYNGVAYDEVQSLFKASNRAFRYGDGIFESIRVINNVICFPENHFKRLCDGALYLRIELPAGFTIGFFREQIENLLELNKIKGDARIRFTLFRGGKGLYGPVTNKGEYLVEAEALPTKGFVLNEKGLELSFCETVRRQRHKLSNLKSANCLVSVLASIWKNENGFDDCVLLNDLDRVAESSSSNIFFMNEDGEVLTPALSEGCVDGTMRKTIIQILKQQEIKLKETKVGKDDLLQAKEIFLTNAISGVLWVKSLNGRNFQKDLPEMLLGELNSLI